MPLSYAEALLPRIGGNCHAFDVPHCGKLYGFIAANKAQQRLEVVGDFLTYEPYGIMFRTNDAQMRDAVDRAFAVMAQTGALVATYHKWFLQPTPTGELLNLPMSLQLTESFPALGVDDF